MPDLAQQFDIEVCRAVLDAGLSRQAAAAALHRIADALYTPPPEPSPLTFLGFGEPDLPRLSPRRKQIIRLVAFGFSNKEIASELRVALRTAETHVRDIEEWAGVHTRVLLVAVALREGVVTLDELYARLDPPDGLERTGRGRVGGQAGLNPDVPLAS